MARSGLRFGGLVGVAMLSQALVAGTADAANLDKAGEIKLGVRTYVNARIGTQNTSASSEVGQYVPTASEGVMRKSRTFPYSAAGHLRQNRFFAEVEYNHDLNRLQKENFGPLRLLNELPSWMRVKNLSYRLTYRGEGDGLYDWGPSEYRTAKQWGSEAAETDPLAYGNNCGTYGVKGCVSRNPATGAVVPVGGLRKRLRDLGTQRQRLFQAYGEFDLGPYLWFRFGRQILSWGETDAFRLLDNINPIDSSFGGFLISLDERRVPLDMLRMNVRTGDIGPLSETFFEFYGAIDNKVGYAPGTPAGSPWALPNTGVPGANTLSQRERPARNFSDMRGGGRFFFNLGDGSFSLAHYYTYFDVPTVQSFVRPGFPVNPTYDSTDPIANAFHDSHSKGWSVLAVQKAPLTQVTGASMTFAAPALYTVFRGEFAYFKDEARFTQAQLDPFVYHFIKEKPGTGEFERVRLTTQRQECNAIINYEKGMGPRPDGYDSEKGTENCRLTGGRRLGDSINMALGADLNQFIRVLNPHQTFFISTQFFFKHLLGAVDRRPIGPEGSGADPSKRFRIPYDGEVLPVTEFDTYVPDAALASFGAVEPNLIAQPTNSYFHTLFIGTNYRSGTVIPSLTFFYDWGGAYVFVPAVTFQQDPWRFGIDYAILSGSRFKGGSGVSLLKDRDSIQFRIEYVI